MDKAKRYFLFSVLCFTWSLAESQVSSYIIKGKVYDAATRMPLVGAIIGPVSGLNKTLSGELGEFSCLVYDTTGALNISYTAYISSKLDWRPYINRPIDVYLEEDQFLLSTTVVTGARYEQSLAETPTSLSVIKSDFIQKNNSNSISEALDKISGVQILDGQANIRGGSGYTYGAGSRVMLLLNDLAILQSDAGFPNWDDLPLENISQVEVLKGASSALFGSAAMNGIVHFRTVEPSEKPFTSIQVAPKIYMAPDTDNYWWKDKKGLPPNELFSTLIHRRRMGKLGMSMSATLFTRQGYRKTHNNTFGRFNSAFFYQIHDRLKLSFHININKGNSSNYFYWKEKASFEGDPGTLTQSKKLRYTLDPGLKYISRKGYIHKWISRYFFVNNQNDGNQANESNNLLSEYTVTKEISSLQLQWLAGFSGNYSRVKAELYGDTTYQFYNAAGFIQLEKRLFKILHLSGGCRVEYYKINGPANIGGKVFSEIQQETKPVFRFGAVTELSKSSFLRISWGQGFRFPTIAEKYILTMAGGLSIVPNPDIQSESGEGFEIGLRQAFRFGNYLKGFADLAYFNSAYQNMIEFGLNSSFQFQSKNVGDTKIQGVELETALQWKKRNWSVNQLAGYTIIDPRFKDFDTGEKLPVNLAEMGTIAQQNAANSSSFENILKYRSKHIFRYNLDVQWKKWFVGANLNYNSQFVAIDLAFEKLIRGVEEFRRENDGGNTIIGFRCGFQSTYWSMQCNLDNAFNELYSLRPALLEAPRSLGFRLTYTF